MEERPKHPPEQFQINFIDTKSTSIEVIVVQQCRSTTIMLKQCLNYQLRGLLLPYNAHVHVALHNATTPRHVYNAVISRWTLGNKHSIVTHVERRHAWALQVLCSCPCQSAFDCNMNTIIIMMKQQKRLKAQSLVVVTLSMWTGHCVPCILHCESIHHEA